MNHDSAQCNVCKTTALFFELEKNRMPDAYFLPHLVFNRSEWIGFRYFTEEEIDNADEKGFIGVKHGVRCYLARPVKVNYEKGYEKGKE